MQTSAGIAAAMRGVGFVGHAGGAAPALTSRTRATAPTAPAIEDDRVAVMTGDYNRAMAVLSRREFGGVIAGAPLAAAMASARLFASDVPLGVSTASFRDLARVPGRDNL